MGTQLGLSDDVAKLFFFVADALDNGTEAIWLVRCLGHSQLISSLSQLVNKLFGSILSWAQTLIRSFTERQLSHKVHAYLVHNLCLACSQGTNNTKKVHAHLVHNSCLAHS